jgi:hypothetical protein
MLALFAFFRRALREHSRSAALIMARGGLALTLVACLVLFGSKGLTLGAAGLYFFNAVVIVNALFITAGACSYFASAIAEEKEDGTLPLLRMTKISPLALLIGKGGTRLLDGLLLLAVQLPFTLIGITLGGITMVQVLSAYVALGAYLVMVCAMGLLASVLAPRPARAAVLAAAMVWLLLYGGQIFSSLGVHFLSSAFGSLDIFSRLREIMATNFDEPIYSEQVHESLLWAVAFFCAAWGFFDRFCTEAVETRIRPGQLLTKRSGEVQRAPVFGLIKWKDTYFLHGSGGMVAWKLAGYTLALFWLGMDVFAPATARLRSDGLAIWGLRVLICGLVAMAAESVVAAARMFRVEHQDRTLAALMGLPNQTAQTLLEAKNSAIWVALRPALVFTITGVCLILLAAITGGRQAGETLAVMAFLISPVGLAFVVPIIWAQGLFLQRLAIHLSLRVRSGAVPLALAIWVLANLLIGLLLALLAPAFGIIGIIGGLLMASFPAGILAAKLREKNVRLIERVAQQE